MIFLYEGVNDKSVALQNLFNEIRKIAKDVVQSHYDEYRIFTVNIYDLLLSLEFGQNERCSQHRKRKKSGYPLASYGAVCYIYHIKHIFFFANISCISIFQSNY